VDLRNLRALLAVMETGSLGRAAELLRTSQPALTKTIRRMEEMLGAPLFTRSARGMQPTIYAQNLHAYAQAATVGMTQAIAQIAALKDGTEGVVSIGAPAFIGAELLPDALVRVTKERPNLQVRVIFRNRDLFAGIKAGHYDFVVSTLYSECPQPGLLWQRLILDRLVAIMRPDHPLAAKRNLTAEDLANTRIVLPVGESHHRRRIELFFAAANRQTPHAAIESNTPDLLKMLVMRSDYIGIVAGLSVQREAAAGSLVIREIDAPSQYTRRPIGFLWRDNDALSPAARSLMSMIEASAREAYVEGAEPRGGSSRTRPMPQPRAASS
jgi:DNA-binding transcriptional LysR family regulator